MTIYDQDYMQELDAQAKATGVVDSVAESPVAVEEAPSEEPQDHIASAGKEIQEPSEKELNFKALREAIAQEKEERLKLQHELDFTKSQLAQQPQVPKKGVLDDERDDDLLTVGKYRQTQQEYEQKLRAQEEDYRLKLNEMEVKLKNPDYDEVLEKFSIPLLKNNRDFARAFQTAEQKAQFAYDLGKKEMLLQRYHELQQEQSKPVETESSRKAERIVANASKPQTLSNARGGQPSLSKSEYWATCSDAEFAKEMEKNLSEV